MQFWSTIIGVIVGGIIAIGGGFVERIWARRQERKSLRAASRAEIQAILAIVERRDYIRQLASFVEAIKSGSTSFFEARIGMDYDIVFRRNCDKLGLLSSGTAARAVRFYYLVSSVREDVGLLRDAGESEHLQACYGLNTQSRNLAFHQQMLQLGTETIALGNDLIRELA